MMDHLLQGMEDFAGAYIDSIIIFSESWETHLHHVEQVLLKLREHNLTANPENASLA